MEDFEEIARALAKPLCEFGTSQALLLAVWNAALAYVRGAAAERLEFLSLGLAHFVRGLNADTAEAVLAQLEGDAVDPVWPPALLCCVLCCVLQRRDISVARATCE